MLKLLSVDLKQKLDQRLDSVRDKRDKIAYEEICARAPIGFQCADNGRDCKRCQRLRMAEARYHELVILYAISQNSSFEQYCRSTLA